MLWVAACTAASTWVAAQSAVLAGPGPYVLTHLTPNGEYWVRAWRDSDGDGARSLGEAWGGYGGNPVVLDSERTNITVTLSDPDTDGDGMPDWWEWQYGRVLTNLEAGADLDGDGAPNVSEYGADTNPTNAASVLRFLAIRRQWGGVRLDWQGGTGACQYLECRQQLDSTNGPWDALLGIPPPTPVTNAVIDLGATNATLFYRLRAERE
jgi:hypothetical protein